MQLGEFIQSVFEVIETTGEKPSAVRFQINFQYASESGIEVIGARITAGEKPIQVSNVPSASGDSFGLDFTIPVSYR